MKLQGNEDTNRKKKRGRKGESMLKRKTRFSNLRSDRVLNVPPEFFLFTSRIFENIYFQIGNSKHKNIPDTKMKISVYVATSLDGYIAERDGGLDWLNELPNPEGSDFGFTDFMKRVDAVVMGRVTFEQVLSFGELPYTKPVFVLSRTLTNLPESIEGKAELLSGTPEEVIDELTARSFESLYLDGGETIHEFLKRDLINELILTRIPVLLGDGIPLFRTGFPEQKYDHVKTEIFNDSLVKSWYRKIPAGQ